MEILAWTSGLNLSVRNYVALWSPRSAHRSLKYYNLGKINVLQTNFMSEYITATNREPSTYTFTSVRVSITVAIETRDNIDNSYPGDENHRHRYLSHLGKLHYTNQHFLTSFKIYLV